MEREIMNGMEIRIRYAERDACDSIDFDPCDAEPCESIGMMIADALSYATQSPVLNLAHAVAWCGDGDTGWAEFDAFMKSAQALCAMHRKESADINGA
jgi:hypothetical protein